jgi:hypothetical protein
LGDSGLLSRKKLMIMDFSVFEDATEVSINQNYEKYFINVGRAGLNDVLD